MSEQLLKEILSTVKSLDSRVGNLETEIKGIITEVAGIKTEFTDIKIEVNGIREEHGLILRALEERTSITNATVTRMAEDMNYIKGDIARIAKRLDDHDVDIRVIKKALAY
jgi:regulator of replication initiation timing